ncbi:cupin domain-containing protein [Methylococcus sp. EFPC2]|uniref:cupin domain-containing protein n=1 Tax=Methylococcus sp. EFPC2 TaxID=2812648 RepID=UPI001966DE40|nr:cupin domain-containing protein [Methylococcus sp. EFPC2]QSA97935.1 cupin domain-containing protein [Methylococcus sp. EFPC2]
MSNKSDIEKPGDDAEQVDLDCLLWENLAEIPPPQRGVAIRQRLMSKIARSAADNANFLTVRGNRGAWSRLRPGVRYKPLWNGSEGNSMLLELAPGAGLPIHRHRWIEEGIVLDGGLQMGDLDLGPGDYHLSPAGSRHGRIASRQGALAFLRGTSLGDTGGALKELLGGLLPHAGGAPLTVYGRDESGWEELAPGVRTKPLWSDGTRRSYFCCLDPGAELEGHAHAIDEECMMLSGDIFLGDLLLRAGDYHLAPAGTRHGPISSDTGALLFVRGQVTP